MPGCHWRYVVTTVPLKGVFINSPVVLLLLTPKSLYSSTILEDRGMRVRLPIGRFRLPQ